MLFENVFFLSYPFPVHKLRTWCTHTVTIHQITWLIPASWISQGPEDRCRLLCDINKSKESLEEEEGRESSWKMQVHMLTHMLIVSHLSLIISKADNVVQYLWSLMDEFGCNCWISITFHVSSPVSSFLNSKSGLTMIMHTTPCHYIQQVDSTYIHCTMSICH